MNNWEIVDDCISRVLAPGGWIYRLYQTGGDALVFVPEVKDQPFVLPEELAFERGYKAGQAAQGDKVTPADCAAAYNRGYEAAQGDTVKGFDAEMVQHLLRLAAAYLDDPDMWQDKIPALVRELRETAFALEGNK